MQKTTTSCHDLDRLYMLQHVMTMTFNNLPTDSAEHSPLSLFTLLSGKYRHLGIKAGIFRHFPKASKFIQRAHY